MFMYVTIAKLYGTNRHTANNWIIWQLCVPHQYSIDNFSHIVTIKQPY